MTIWLTPGQRIRIKPVASLLHFICVTSIKLYLTRSQNKGSKNQLEKGLAYKLCRRENVKVSNILNNRTNSCEICSGGDVLNICQRLFKCKKSCQHRDLDETCSWNSFQFSDFTNQKIGAFCVAFSSSLRPAGKYLYWMPSFACREILHVSEKSVCRHRAMGIAFWEEVSQAICLYSLGKHIDLYLLLFNIIRVSFSLFTP